MTDKALRTTFAATHSVRVAELYVGDHWEHQRKRFREEHDRDRGKWQAEGFVLGPVVYRELDSADNGRLGEWYSEILRDPPPP